MIHLDTHVAVWLWAGERARLEPVRVRLSTAPLVLIVAAAVGMSWTSDPFDRLIAGNALAEGAPLLTRDESIRAHCPWARWTEA